MALTLESKILIFDSQFRKKIRHCPNLLQGDNQEEEMCCPT